MDDWYGRRRRRQTYGRSGAVDGSDADSESSLLRAGLCYGRNFWNRGLLRDFVRSAKNQVPVFEAEFSLRNNWRATETPSHGVCCTCRTCDVEYVGNPVSDGKILTSELLQARHEVFSAMFSGQGLPSAEMTEV